MRFLATLGKELRYQLRSFRLLSVGAVLILLGLLSPLIAKFTPHFLELLPNGKAMSSLFPTPTAQDAIAQYVKNISQIGLVLVVLLTMGAVANEKDKGTAAMLLCKPLPRATFILAKFLSLAAVFAVSVVLAAVACAYYTTLLFGPLRLPAWAAANGLIVLYFVLYEAIALFFSTVGTQVVAGGLSFAVIAVFGVLGTLPVLGEYFPAQLLRLSVSAYAGSIAGWQSIPIGAAIVVAATAAAILVFRRQEL